MSPSFFAGKRANSTAPPEPPMQMPNVFVVPPEEDQVPAWCFFDADNPALSQIVEQPETSQSSSFFFFDEEGLPSSTYDERSGNVGAGIIPGMDGESMSIIDAANAINDNYRRENDMESDLESDYGGELDLDEDHHSINESSRHQPRDIRNVADDSDVIEVVKVSRRTRIPDGHETTNGDARPPAKRSATLRSRASKVFKSLKGSLRSSKSKAQETSPPPLPTPPVPPIPYTQKTADTDRSRTPTITRRASITLTQLFRAPSLRSKTSMASMDDRPMSPTDSASVASPTSSAHPPTRSLYRRPSLYTAAEHDAARLRAASPTPTTTSTKSSTRRFSVLKLFTFTPAPTDPIPTCINPEESGRTTPTQRSNTSTPASVESSVLTSGPHTPTSTEEVNSVRLVSPKETDPDPQPVFDNFDSVFDSSSGLNLGLGLALQLDSNENENTDIQATPRKSRSNSLRQTWESVTPRRFSFNKERPPVTPDLDEEGDQSLEMRLDSLHFDDISFDADKFAAHEG